MNVKKKKSLLENKFECQGHTVSGICENTMSMGNKCLECQAIDVCRYCVKTLIFKSQNNDVCDGCINKYYPNKTNKKDDGYITKKDKENKYILNKEFANILEDIVRNLNIHFIECVYKDYYYNDIVVDIGDLYKATIPFSDIYNKYFFTKREVLNKEIEFTTKLQRDFIHTNSKNYIDKVETKFTKLFLETIRTDGRAKYDLEKEYPLII